MGWVDHNARKEQRPHWYVVFCDGDEVGSAAEAGEACDVARRHAKARALEWTRKARIWFAVAGGRLYEVRKLREARPSPLADLLTRGRRHG